MSETVKRWVPTGLDSDPMMCEAFEGEDDYYIHATDYAALEARLAEAEFERDSGPTMKLLETVMRERDEATAQVKALLSKAPAYAEEVRRLGREVVELTKAFNACVAWADAQAGKLEASFYHIEEDDFYSGPWLQRDLMDQAKPHPEASGDSGELD